MSGKVPGHALDAYGAAFVVGDDGALDRVGDTKWSTVGVGRAHCRCGWLSGMLPTAAARRRAYRGHLDEAINGLRKPCTVCGLPTTTEEGMTPVAVICGRSGCPHELQGEA